MASTPTDRLVKLRSPFNGEVFTVPPDYTPALVAELIKRGFERVDEDKPRKEKA